MSTDGDRFPWFHMGILATGVFASAISLSGLFPYVGFMVIYLKQASNENEAGYYSGFIASSMMFGRLVSSLWWGQLADTYGRRPILMISCMSIATFSIMFGCSQTFQMALISRFLLGLANPLWGIAKTLVSELCPPKHEAKGMGLTSGCWSLGLVVGPACGGLLASPATLYPDLFGSMPLFVKYPYLLPNLVTAGFGLIGLLLIGLFFPETLHTNRSTTTTSSEADHDGVGRTAAQESAAMSGDKHLPTSTPVLALPKKESSKGASAMELCRTPGVIHCLLAYIVISFNSIVFDEVVPLWSMASPELGGLGLKQMLIGNMLTITGVVLTIYTFTLYPVAANYLGDRLGFRVSMALFGPIVAAITLLSYFNLHASVRFALLVVMYTLTKATTALGFSSIALMTNHCVGKEKRASLNGLTMTFGSIAKAVGPLSGALVFAWSLNSSFGFPLDFHLMFLILFALSGVAVVMKLPAEVIDTSNKADIELMHITDDAPVDKGAVDGINTHNSSNTPYSFILSLLGIAGNNNGLGTYAVVSTKADDLDEGV